MISTVENQNHGGELLEAAVRQWTWKTPAMKAMTIAVLRLALAKAHAEFSANDLPEFEHGGSGVAGVVFHRLVQDGVLARVGKFEGQTFYPKVVLNKGGNKIGVYRLKNFSLAKRALEIHGAAEPDFEQGEMKLT